MSDLLLKLKDVESSFREVEQRLSLPEVLSDQAEYRKVVKRHAEMEPVVKAYAELRQAYAQRDEAKSMLDDSDSEVAEMARSELESAAEAIERLEGKIRLMLVPLDPNDDKNIIVEIRAGTGGDEAGLFAGDLLRMYTRYAELRGWKFELLGENRTGVGGFKEVSLSVSGGMVYSQLKYESGTHRVQRVPETEAQGRIHTSAVTVAVLPEAEEVDVAIRPDDLRIDTYCSSGPGGQSVNTTYSAVRITHLPTNTVVSIQDEKSQIKNREKAMKVLRARLYEMEQAKQNAAIAATRKAMVGTGDRSQRIRTYNFPQNRLTDHRIGLTLHSLDRVMEGELGDVIEALVLHDRTERLRALDL
ncbi:peptide chain release factor 1 [Candidatus Sumerlaeota bacterium]|nr:peptide chain release factor 1 [Candidatus Sumerlaeota bacterium]